MYRKLTQQALKQTTRHIRSNLKPEHLQQTALVPQRQISTNHNFNSHSFQEYNSSKAQISHPAMSTITLTTSRTSSGSEPFFDALANRRSYYALSDKSTISDAKIESILATVLKKTPSSFNSQSTRMVLVLGAAHKQLWDAVKSIMHAKLGDERYPATGKKLDGFRAGYGTVLFYEDTAVVESLKANFKSYAAQFDGWSEHASGMHQLATWVALEAEGLGANLQHYNPLIDDKLREMFSVPEAWFLKSQLVFGTPVGGRPAEKDKKPLEETLKVFKA